MHGPQAALGIRSTAVRSSNARTHAITRVTKAFIAYVATQVRLWNVSYLCYIIDSALVAICSLEFV